MDSTFDKRSQEWLDGKGPIPPEVIASCRRDLEKARPYDPGEEDTSLLDCYDNPRSDATMAMNVLKNAGVWTEEYEKLVLMNSPPLPPPPDESISW